MSRRAARALAALGLAAALAAASPARAEAPRKFALGVFHFNIQYVVGGLLGFLPTAEPIATWELDEAAVEDQIVRESFEPVLDLFLAHPTWGTDIELQGLFLEVLEARHPDVLEKLRALAASGQIEVLSFHYSDQLFLAFPSDEWRRSQAATRAVFERLGIPLGTSVFCQEGQAGLGMASAMAERGYRTMVWPTNLWKYQHGDGEVAPRYRFGGRDDVEMVVGGRDVHYAGAGGPVDAVWTFLDDGELLATGDLDPYFPPIFQYQPEAVAEYERELASLEAQGYAVTTTARYVAALAELGVPPAEPPPLLDGTWQPQSTDGIKRWLGGVGLWSDAERDNEVRTLQAMAHRELMAAETAGAAAGTTGDGSAGRAALDGAWRLLSLAEVSDSSGINPYRGEIQFGIAHATEALRVARAEVRAALAALGRRSATIDTATGSVAARVSRSAPPSAEPVLEPVVAAPGREVAVRWTREEPGASRVTFDFGPVTSGSERAIQVRFPGEPGDIVYSRGLAEDAVVSERRADFGFDRFQLALANGLIGLGPSRFLVKDQATIHLAATVRRDRPDVVFGDDTAPADQAATWSFVVADGVSAELALAMADHLNVHPTLDR